MLKDFAWQAFEKTGNIDTYIFYREIENKAVTVNEIEEVEDQQSS